MTPLRPTSSPARWPFAFLLTLCFVVTEAKPALADQKAAAEALFQEAKKLSAKGDLPQACPKFQASFKLDPQLGTLMNWADCLEATERLASAWARWTEAAEWAKRQADKRQGYIRGRKMGVESRLPKLTLNVTATTPEAKRLGVARNSQTIPVASFGIPLPLDPGKHTLRVKRGKKTLESVELTIAEGERKTQAFNLDSIARAHPEPKTEQPLGAKTADGPITLRSPEPVSNTQRNVGIGIGAVGAGTSLAAIGLLVAAVIKKNQANQPDRCVNGFCTPQGFDAAETAGRYAEVSQWLGIGGLTTLTVGATVWLTAPSSSDEHPEPGSSEVGMSLAPWVEPNGQGVTLRMTW